MADGGRPAIPRMRRDERGLAVLSHLSSIVPLWALLVNGILYFSYRESSRAVCFHARQGINFQLLLLAAFIPLFFLHLLADLLEVVLAPVLTPEAVVLVGKTVNRVASGGEAVFLTLYILCCLTGVVQALRGRIFVYPVAGRHAYQVYLKAMLRGR